MVAESAFGGAAGEVVLHAMAEENLGAAIIPADGDGHGDEALGPLAAFAEILAQIEEIRDLIKLLRRHGEDRILQQRWFHDGI